MRKFKEELDTAVITTKFVIDNNSPILFVFHYEDGFWQFSGVEENLKDEDYRVVSLGEIIQIDLSILNISNIALESKAIRKSKELPWKIIPIRSK